MGICIFEGVSSPIFENAFEIQNIISTISFSGLELSRWGKYKAHTNQ